MEAKERREKLLARLKMAQAPLTGTSLAKELGVSRQIIVGDIAILRAAGLNIYATPQGYILPSTAASYKKQATLACRHSRDELHEELSIIVKHGATVLDVVVEHPLYGEMRANLMLSTQAEIDSFLQRLTQSGAEPISIVTGGIHLHTIEADSEAVILAIREELKEKGLLVK